MADRPKREHVTEGLDGATGMHYARLALGPHDNLVYLLGDPESRTATVVDPAFDVPRILSLLDDWGCTLEAALFTHNHWDHTEGAEAIHKATGCALMIHEADAAPLAANGLPVTSVQDGDHVTLGTQEVRVHHMPGHTAGGVTYQAGKRLFTGDFLFIGTAGRTDFPTGSKQAMWSSLQRFKERFADDALICPGHDYGDTPEATLGAQRRDNPALAHTDYDAFKDEWFLVAY